MRPRNLPTPRRHRSTTPCRATLCLWAHATLFRSYARKSLTFSANSATMLLRVLKSRTTGTFSKRSTSLLSTRPARCRIHSSFQRATTPCFCVPTPQVSRSAQWRRCLSLSASSVRDECSATRRFLLVHTASSTRLRDSILMRM